MKKSLKVAYLLWFVLGWAFGVHRIYLNQEGWWIYPLLWFLTFFGIYLGPGALTFLLLLGFWIYDAFKIPEWVKGKED
jgi:TM2 domain-containing membrane protein YozV